MKPSERIYRWLLHLYPGDFRDEYGQEMSLLFRARAISNNGQSAEISSQRYGFRCLQLKGRVAEAVLCVFGGGQRMRWRRPEARHT